MMGPLGPLFSSEREAAEAWSARYRELSEKKEHVALIYSAAKTEGKGYALGRTFPGAGRWGPFRPNVVIPFIYLYCVEALKVWLLYRYTVVAVIHTHPRPPEGMTYRHHSPEDLLLLKLPGIAAVYVVPYENTEVNRMPG